MKTILTLGHSKYLISDLKKANKISELMQGAKSLDWAGYNGYTLDPEPLLVGVETVRDTCIKKPTETEAL